jgi:polyphosphate kinase 2 (PPK2 family)
VATAIRDAIGKALQENRGVRIAAKPSGRTAPARSTPRAPDTATILSQLDMTQTVSKKVFATELEKQQGRLNQLQRRARDKGVSTLLVFEGWDAAGKGGAIRRVTAALDAPDYQVIPIAAPTDEERAQHYLWRFWRHLSRAGRVTIFDRSWYGRVLVERVEGLATEAQWRRAYDEINDFERMLASEGMIILKLWLHISDAEQLRRFERRRDDPLKAWKLTEEDWRNRGKRGAYEAAVEEMLVRTDTDHAPWRLIEGDSKRWARVKVMETVIAAIEDGCARVGFPLPEPLGDAAAS